MTSPFVKKTIPDVHISQSTVDFSIKVPGFYVNHLPGFGSPWSRLETFQRMPGAGNENPQKHPHRVVEKVVEKGDVFLKKKVPVFFPCFDGFLVF